MINVYVDVDGVLNGVFAKPGQGGWDKHCHRREQINWYTITWHADMVYRLRKALDRDDVRPVWLTTWTDDATRLISPALGIGQHWPVLHPSRTTFGKQTALLDHMSETGPDKVLWLDDDASYNPVRFTDVEFKRISPETRVGLTTEHLEEIERFLS